MSQPKTICEIVRDAESNYLEGPIKMGDYVDFFMHDVIEKIDAYLNSKHLTGDKDSLGREKPFFNIVTASVNIWYRATDIDRKNIRFIPESQKSVPLAFVAGVLLQQWMDKYRFGQFLNLWGRALARYGSAVLKFVEKDGELIPSVIPWNRIICDPVDFDALPRIEKFYKTPAQLYKMGYDSKKVDELVDAISTRKTLAGQPKDKQSKFIELYEVHGELDSRLLGKETNRKDKRPNYVQQMHVVSFVKTDKGYADYTLYSGLEDKDPYMLTHLIEEDGRTLSIGAVESLFDAQWMQNHTVKNMKDTLDLASRLIFQTSDTRYVGRNVLSAIETGDIFIHAVNMPLTRVANDKPDIAAFQNFGTMWHNLVFELTSTPDAIRGNTMPSGTSYALGSYLGSQANSLFEIMTENKGLDLETMLRKYVIPNLKKKLKNKKEVLAILDDAGIKEIDMMYIPNEAIKRHNENFKNAVLNGEQPQPFDPMAMQQNIQQEMANMGNRRPLVPSEMGDKTWAEIFSDFEWDNIRVEVTNENVDKQAVLQTLNSLFQGIGAIAAQGRSMSDDERLVFNKILEETGRISPIQLTSKPAIPSGGLPLGNQVGAGVSGKELAIK